MFFNYVYLCYLQMQKDISKAQSKSKFRETKIVRWCLIYFSWVTCKSWTTISKASVISVKPALLNVMLILWVIHLKYRIIFALISNTSGNSRTPQAVRSNVVYFSYVICKRWTTSLPRRTVPSSSQSPSMYSATLWAGRLGKKMAYLYTCNLLSSDLWNTYL